MCGNSVVSQRQHFKTSTLHCVASQADLNFKILRGVADKHPAMLYPEYGQIIAAEDKIVMPADSLPKTVSAQH